MPELPRGVRPHGLDDYTDEIVEEVVRERYGGWTREARWNMAVVDDMAEHPPEN